MEIKDNDIVLIKSTFSIATITGVYLSKNHFEVDNDEDSYHHRDELFLWSRGGKSKETIVSLLGDIFIQSSLLMLPLG